MNKDYIDSTYGRCSKNDAGKRCECLKTGWVGALCPHWTPLSAIAGRSLESYTDMLAFAKERYHAPGTQKTQEDLGLGIQGEDNSRNGFL